MTTDADLCPSRVRLPVVRQHRAACTRSGWCAMTEVTDPQVLNVLARELLSVSTERAAARPETEAVKRIRRLDLNEELHPRADRPHTLAEQLEHAEVMGGRIFNLPGDHLDRVARLARTSKRRRHIRAAQQQIDRRRL